VIVHQDPGCSSSPATDQDHVYGNEYRLRLALMRDVILPDGDACWFA
jgi:hypothetical protein